MSTRAFASQMRSAIENLKAQGVAAVYVDNLIQYLTSVEESEDPNPSLAELERYKAQLAQHIESMKHSHAADLEMFKSVVVAGQNAIRTMTVINGGASLAMLAFIGHLARIGSDTIPTYAYCLAYFVLGTWSAGLVSGVTYLSQWLYGGDRNTSGMVMNVIAILLGIGAYALFGLGAYEAYDAFVNNPPTADPSVVEPAR